MTLLVPHPRPSMRLDDLQPGIGADRGVVSHSGLGGVDLDAAKVLGAHEAVLIGAHQPQRCTVVSVEMPAVEMLGEDDVITQGVFEQNDRSVAIEALEDQVADQRSVWKSGL